MASLPAAFSSLLPAAGARRRPGWPAGALLLAYGVAFWLAHQLARRWGAAGFYSFWYPAAGVRVALLWRRGAAWAPAVAATELIVQIAAGVVDIHDPDWLTALIGVIRPPLLYGLAIALVRRMASRSRSSVAIAPMPFGLAAVLAPATAVLGALPWSIWRPDITRIVTVRELIGSLSGFFVGDLLGVLLVAPPLLWAAERWDERRTPVAAPNWQHVAEGLTALSLAFGAAALLTVSGLRVPATPPLLAVTWIGLRFGRAAAWLAIAAVAAAVLPWSAHLVAIDQRLALHLAMASVAVVGFTAGSFADAQIEARADLERRDRLLFQAERLKTLRAMSVAVIHEVSQPLSTLVIEAKHLHELSVSADAEIASGAALIHRKAAALSDLVRRLRRFGGRAADEPSPIPLTALLDTVRELAAAEAKAARVRLEVTWRDPDLVILAQEVELAQAVINLVRNAIRACDDGVVRVTCHRMEDQAVISIANRCAAPAPSREGMGVGLFVARAITEAHGGRIDRDSRDGTVVHHLRLPLAEMLP